MSAPAAAPDRYAVVGHPVAHSRSPFIHACFAEATGEAIVYRALDVAPDEFERGVDAFRAEPGRGLNVTVPHKERAFEYADRLSDRARLAGAVNTLRFDPDGSAFGDNTDGVGLVRDLERNLGVALRSSRILVIGAGGAARGVIGPLLEAGPSVLTIANRTRARADALAARFAAHGPVVAIGLDGAFDAPGYDLVVNATSASLSCEAPPLARAALAPEAWCYDMMYAPRATPFLERAAALGARHAADGRGMLVEQAAESFFVWRGIRPQTGPVIEALGAALSGGAESGRQTSA